MMVKSVMEMYFSEPFGEFLMTNAMPGMNMFVTFIEYENRLYLIWKPGYVKEWKLPSVPMPSLSSLHVQIMSQSATVSPLITL
jgi:hypothetical protein